MDEACSERYDPSTTEMSGVTDIYARWTINNYTLKFNFTNGTVSSITLPFNASIEYPEVISEREGFTFIEWSPRPERMPAKNITAKAQWRANKYTITFEANGGSECPSITQDYNTPVTLPVPTKTGYTFAYWFSDIELTTKYTATTMPTENKTLYAKWVINQYTITFDFGNGTENVIELPFDTIIEYPEDNPEKEGFTFIEWSPKPERMAAEDITVTAQWVAKEYEATFDATGGDVTPTNKKVTYDSTYGDLPTATRDGYGFDGWYTEANGGGEKIEPNTVVSITDAQTLYANWIADAVTVTFDAKGGVSTQTSKTVTFGSTYGELPTATRAGYTFAGWFTEEGIEGTLVTKDTQVTNSNHHTIYAHWTINQYTLTFEVNGGTGVEPITQEYNTAVTLPEPTKTGYTFDYWCSDIELNTKYEEITMPAENKTLYAKWTINQYTLRT